jgi:hypothetical protein
MTIKFVLVLAIVATSFLHAANVSAQPVVYVYPPAVTSVEANSSRAATRFVQILNGGSATFSVGRLYAYADSVTLQNFQACRIISQGLPGPWKDDLYKVVSVQWRAESSSPYGNVSVSLAGPSGSLQVEPSGYLYLAVTCPAHDGSALPYLVMEPSAIAWASSGKHILPFSNPVVPIGICAEGGSGVTAQFPNSTLFETLLPSREQGAKAWLFTYSAIGTLYFSSTLASGGMSGLVFGGYPWNGSQAAALEVASPSVALPAGEYAGVVTMTVGGTQCWKSFGVSLSVP